MTQQDVAVVEQTPRAILQAGADQANALMEIVTRSKDAVASNIGGKRYLRFEAWQTIARFNRASPVTVWTHAVRDDEDRVAGYEARVEVRSLDTGHVVAAAESMCGMDEFVTQGQRTEFAKRNACRSMAQTRAAAKALRMAYSFVAVLAGFEATPAEEMPGRGEEEGVPQPQQPPLRMPPQQRPSAPPRHAEERSERRRTPPDETTRFFAGARGLGFDAKAALGALGVPDLNSYLAKGKSIDDALNELREMDRS